MRSVREKQVVVSLGLGLILAAYLFLLMPFTIYVGNINEFQASFGAILGVEFKAILFLVAALCLVGMLLPARYFTAYKTLLATISILFWLQGSLLVWDYGPLDGRAIDWMEDAWRGWIDLGIWLLAVIVALVAHRRIVQHAIRIAVILFLLQLLVFFTNLFNNSAELSKESEVSNSEQSLKKLYRFSSQKNVVQIIADGFQSDIFEDIIREGGEGEQITSALEGFTFFRENLGVFPYTHMTVPAILSGKIYRNDMPIPDFQDKTIGAGSILDAAYDAGYEVDLAVPSGLEFMYRKSRNADVYPVPGQIRSTRAEIVINDTARLLDLVLFRLSPHFVKKYVYNDQFWLLQQLLSDEKYKGFSFFAHTAFLKDLRENMVADRQRPVYKLLHLMLSHRPMVTNPQCGFAGQVLRTVRSTVTSQARCGLREVIKLFEAMKRLGIYNDALIILMADHGAWVTPRRLKAKLSSDGKSYTMINPSVMALALPLLAIKRPNESGALKISDAPTWIVDTSATIADVLGLDAKFNGRSVFKLPQDEKRERRFFFYDYKSSEWTDKYLGHIHEFTVNGNGVDSGSWRFARTWPEGNEEKPVGKNHLWWTVKPAQ